MNDETRMVIDNAVGYGGDNGKSFVAQVGLASIMGVHRAGGLFFIAEVTPLRVLNTAMEDLTSDLEQL